MDIGCIFISSSQYDAKPNDFHDIDHDNFKDDCSTCIVRGGPKKLKSL